MRWLRIWALAAMMAATGIAADAARPVANGGSVAGLWINPYNSVAVRTGACEGKLCGWIVWANASARSDAHDEGVDQLLGLALLQDYAANRDGSWSGTVYVPDMGRRFSSTITPVGRDQLKVKGCLVGGFLCRSQVWQRIDKVPNA